MDLGAVSFALFDIGFFFLLIKFHSFQKEKTLDGFLKLQYLGKTKHIIQLIRYHFANYNGLIRKK